MDEHVSKAFDTAQDASKQLLTVAAGIVVLTITFFEDFGKHAPFSAKVLLLIAWIVYSISILCGICTLQTLAGNLQNKSLSIYQFNTKLFSIGQIATFLTALALTVVAGGLSWL
jgi:hypothetical protein